MMTINKERGLKRDLLLAGVLIVAGVAISGLSLTQVDTSTGRLQVAQATQPLQSTPGAETKPTAPDDPKDTSARPRDVAPQPARPDADAVDAGTKPALPPAPAEKTGEPIQPKS
jgi:cytoskeletal protein RodZ